MKNASLSHTRLTALLRDLATGTRQQMFFWGNDVVHPDGNLFLANGFTKRPSTGLQGTSCYARPWQNGTIELHGSHAGWFGPDAAFLFVRPMGRYGKWLGEAPPVPGIWPRELIDAVDPETFTAAAIPFLRWWLAFEDAVLAACGPAYRIRHHRKYKALPKSRPWRTPADATAWLRLLVENPAAAPRAKHFTRQMVA